MVRRTTRQGPKPARISAGHLLIVLRRYQIPCSIDSLSASGWTARLGDPAKGPSFQRGCFRTRDAAAAWLLEEAERAVERGSQGPARLERVLTLQGRASRRGGDRGRQAGRPRRQPWSTDDRTAQPAGGFNQAPSAGCQPARWLSSREWPSLRSAPVGLRRRASGVTTCRPRGEPAPSSVALRSRDRSAAPIGASRSASVPTTCRRRWGPAL